MPISSKYLYTARSDVWKHTIHVVEAYSCDCEEGLNPIDLITALAVFFHDIGKPHCYQDGEDGIRHFIISAADRNLIAPEVTRDHYARKSGVFRTVTICMKYSRFFILQYTG